MTKPGSTARPTAWPSAARDLPLVGPEVEADEQAEEGEDNTVAEDADQPQIRVADGGANQPDQTEHTTQQEAPRK